MPREPDVNLFELRNDSVSVVAQFLKFRQLFRGKTPFCGFRDQFRKLLPWRNDTSAHMRMAHAITLLKAVLNLLISSCVPTLTRM
jgi:hypothetical protein